MYHDKAQLIFILNHNALRFKKKEVEQASVFKIEFLNCTPVAALELIVVRNTLFLYALEMYIHHADAEIKV